MAHVANPSRISIIAGNNCVYESEITDFDPNESFGLLDSILETFEKMRRGKIDSLTIALFESGPKGFIPGNFIETLNYSDYYNPRYLSDIENQMIRLEKHYTRVDLVRRAEYAETLIFKRIRTIGLFEWKKHFNYLTKVYCASGMELVELSKLMNQAGLTSSHIKNILKRYDQERVN